MYRTAPPNMRPAQAAPMTGHGLGSTRWYGCLGPPWLVLMLGSLAWARPSIHGSRLCGKRRGLDGLDLALLGTEHGVGQRDRVDVPRIGIIDDRGIDEERHAQIGALAGFQVLLREAEALQLVEVDAGLDRCHVEGRGSRLGVAALVDRAIGDHLLLAGMDLDRELQRPEFP